MRKPIRITNHKPDCQDPFHCIALNSRKGKQTPRRHTNYCPSCDQYQKVDFTGGTYERIGDTNILKLTRKTKPRIFGNLDKKFSKEELRRIENRTGLTLEKATTTKYISFKERRKVDPVNFSIRTKEISNEQSLKKQLNGLEYFYFVVNKRLSSWGLQIRNQCGAEKLGWDSKLVKKFLKTKPSIEALVRALIGPSLEFVVSAKPGQLKFKHIGHVKGGEDDMFLTCDYDAFIKIAMAEIKTRNEVMKAVIKKKKRKVKKKIPMPLIYA